MVDRMRSCELFGRRDIIRPITQGPRRNAQASTREPRMLTATLDLKLGTWKKIDAGALGSQTSQPREPAVQMLPPPPPPPRPPGPFRDRRMPQPSVSADRR